VVNRRRVRRVRQQVRDDLFCFDEVKDETTWQSTLEQKERRYELVQLDGQQVRHEVFDDEFPCNEDEEPNISEQQKHFVYPTDDGRRIRHQVLKDEYEYDMEDDEAARRRPRYHEFAQLDGRTVHREVRQGEFECGKDGGRHAVEYEHRSIGRRRCRIRKHPEGDLKYILGSPQVLVKRQKAFERFEDPSTKRVYRTAKPEIEHEEVRDADGALTCVAKPKEFDEFQMVSKARETIQVKPPVLYKLE
jgi:hypothetical protein